MLQFNFVIPFLIALILLILIVWLHIVYRRNADKIIKELVQDKDYLSKSLIEAKSLTLMEANKHKDFETYSKKMLNDAAKVQQNLRNQLAESTQLNEDLQKTLTALRRHKANQRNSRKAQPRNHSQQGQSK